MTTCQVSIEAYADEVPGIIGRPVSIPVSIPLSILTPTLNCPTQCSSKERLRSGTMSFFTSWQHVLTFLSPLSQVQEASYCRLTSCPVAAKEVQWASRVERHSSQTTRHSTINAMVSGWNHRRQSRARLRIVLAPQHFETHTNPHASHHLQVPP
ncbi:uncharacterized protein LY79DRAFT_366568 [Colletotrichum navitas]|uniref:Uncharacterized protein n=1 Tax=Colletotrichum navitas TaxID=681940 RepID=A0AAD8PRM7_9PEZI|nr:uncharacterized protein LY79DRAFT_366568 [Colletotrichum navitas]KAK1574448.1 hypothetical protein LY79DRAFT_366568 [Colletotrichum navitas]